jgi:hypothetical protein
MKDSGTKFLFFFALLSFAFSITAHPTQAANLSCQGTFQSQIGVSLQDDHAFTRLETGLVFQPKVSTTNLQLYGEIQLHIPALTDPTAAGLLQIPVNLTDVTVNEAYIDLYGFPHPQVDLTLGKQLLPWGTGYQLNPTANLNPEDFRSPFDFGRRLGVQGLMGKVYFENLTVTMVGIPTFTPAALPEGDLSSLISAYSDQAFSSLPPGLSFTEELRLNLPENNWADAATWGIKIDKPLWGWDFSLSYVRGRYTLPVAERLTIILPSVDHEDSDPVQPLQAELTYPRRQVVGVDWAGAIGDYGLWGEAAFFFPEAVTTTIDGTALGLPVREETALKDTAYGKYLVGMDYGTDRIYLNLQYIYGFPQEMDHQNLGHFLVATVEWTLKENKLKFPLNFVWEIRNLDKKQPRTAHFIAPELRVYPDSNTELALILRLIDGEAGTVLGNLKTWDEVEFKVKYSF